MAHVAEFLVAGVEEFAAGLAGEHEQLALEDVAEEFGGGFVVAMGSAIGFGNDFVDDAEVLEVGGGDFHGDGAVSAFVESRQRMEAQPSGEMTE